MRQKNLQDLQIDNCIKEVGMFHEIYPMSTRYMPNLSTMKRTKGRFVMQTKMEPSFAVGPPNLFVNSLIHERAYMDEAFVSICSPLPVTTNAT